MFSSQTIRQRSLGWDRMFSTVMLLQSVFFGFTSVIVSGQNETDSLGPNTACSVCMSGEKMKNSTAIVPGGLVSFLTEPMSCVRIELEAMALQFSSSQCAELVESEIHGLCGCEPLNTGGGNDTSPEFEVLTGRLFITLAPLSFTMSEAVQIEYEAVLKSFFTKYLLNVQSTTLIKQTLINFLPSGRLLHNHPKRNLQGNASISLQTHVQVEYVVDKDSELIGTNKFDQVLEGIVNNNTDTLLNALSTMNYFADVNYVSGSLTPQSDTPKEVPADDSQDGDDDLSIQVIVGIIIGVIAVILAIPVIFQLMCVVPLGSTVAPTNGSTLSKSVQVEREKELSVSKPAKVV